MLSSTITPLAYLYGIQGVIYGLGFTVFSDTPGIKGTILFQHDALIGVLIWGVVALASSGALLLGLIYKNSLLAQPGSLGMFLCWVFAGIVYASGGYYFLLLPLAMINILSYGYIYLAASLNTLWGNS
jgi:hypothetical protein